MHKPILRTTIKTRLVHPLLVLATAALFPALAASPADASIPLHSTVTTPATTVTTFEPMAPQLPGLLTGVTSLSLSPVIESQREGFIDRKLTQTTTPPPPRPSTVTQPAAPESIGPDDGNAPLVAAIVLAILLIAGAGFFFSQRNQRNQP